MWRTDFPERFRYPTGQAGQRLIASRPWTLTKCPAYQATLHTVSGHHPFSPPNFPDYARPQGVIRPAEHAAG